MRSLLVVLALVVGCTASQREKTITATYATTNATYDGLTKLADDREGEIVKAAPGLDVGRYQLAAFRAKVDLAEKTLGLVYRAIATALILNNDQSLGALLQVTAILVAEIEDLKRPIPISVPIPAPTTLPKAPTL